MAAEMQIAEFYKTTRKLLMFCSMWIEPEDKRWIFKEYLKRFIWSYLTGFLFLISVTMDMMEKTSSIEEWADASYYFFMQCSFVLKIIWFRLRYKKFKFLITGHHRLVDDDTLNDKSFLKKSNLVTNVFFGNCYFNGIFMCILPFIEKYFTHQLRLPLSTWFPWDIDKSMRGKISGYLIQVLSVFSGMTINASLDMLVVELLLASCWQVRLLKNNLSRINRKMSHKEINEKMISCTKHYLAIMEYVKLVEDVFGNGLFFQFLASGCGMCITGIEVIVIPMGSGRFFTTIGYLMALVIQISAYCWAGQQLITESDGITNSCYNMDWWYDCVCSKEAKTTLYLMMERSKRPLSIRAGRFFPLSVFTLATIFRTSYSYFAVLQSMHAKNQEQ